MKAKIEMRMLSILLPQSDFKRVIYVVRSVFWYYMHV